MNISSNLVWMENTLTRVGQKHNYKHTHINFMTKITQ